MTPCEAGPAVMRPLTDLDEARAILADLLSLGRLELTQVTHLERGRETYYMAQLWSTATSHLLRQRNGATLDEALRALHRAIAPGVR